MGRPSKGPIRTENFKFPAEIAEELAFAASRSCQTKTEIVLEALEAHLKAKRAVNEADVVREYSKLDMEYEIGLQFDKFDKIKFSSYRVVKDWAEKLIKFRREAQRYELGPNFEGAIDTRLVFINSFALPDAHNELIDKNGVKKHDKLWYSFKDFLNNGCRRPPKPNDWYLDPIQRQRREESRKEAQRLGLPFNGPDGVPVIQETRPIPQLEHREETHNDPLFDKLMDEAIEMEKKDANPHSGQGKDTEGQPPSEAANSPRRAQDDAERGGSG